MRTRRFPRACARLALLVILTLAVLLAPPPSQLLASDGGGAGTGTTVPDGGPAGRAAATDDETAEWAAETDDGTPAVGRAWPVGVRPRVLRGWEPPATVYARGHRGVDLAAAPGTPVRAVAAGRISFAGGVAGRGVVSVELAGTGDPPLRTTHEPVRASVDEGDVVAAGEVIGTVEPTGSHCTAPCVHWGLLRGDTYLNPLTLLPPWLLRRGPSRLLPVLGVPLPGRRVPVALHTQHATATAAAGTRRARPRTAAPVAGRPSRNSLPAVTPAYSRRAGGHPCVSPVHPGGPWRPPLR